MTSEFSAVERKARDQERSRAWWEQRLALGICAACRHPLPDGATFALHPSCGYLQRQHSVRYRELRRMSVDEINRRADALRQPRGRPRSAEVL